MPTNTFLCLFQDTVNPVSETYLQAYLTVSTGWFRPQFVMTYSVSTDDCLTYGLTTEKLLNTKDIYQGIRLNLVLIHGLGNIQAIISGYHHHHHHHLYNHWTVLIQVIYPYAEQHIKSLRTNTVCMTLAELTVEKDNKGCIFLKITWLRQLALSGIWTKCRMKIDHINLKQIRLT